MPKPRLIAILLSPLLLACGGPEDTLDDLTLLSGIWYGTQDIHQAGACTINGNDHVSSDQVYRLDVLSTGFVEVTDSARGTLVFRGWVEDDLRVELVTNYSVSCPSNVTHTDSATHDGRFKLRNDYYELNTSGTEVWCPPDCVFDVIYQLRKNF